MNFLAHLHLAQLADSSLLGNLMADFVRGNPRDVWPDNVAAGILLHRRIDVMTDALPEVRVARGFFRPETYRVSPIALDVIWDHFLSRHWDEIVPETALPDFLRRAQAEIGPHLATTPERFQNLNRYLWTDRWMEKYAQALYLQNVLSGMASRRPRLIALADCYQDFTDNYQQFESIFRQFYPQMMAKARQQLL
ncbi:MAG TPA: ACP phosphodiesterase [Erwinia sp.]|uniref:ACP phosphodiesterase n=1 Tax=Erwinia citreus TaxID=558 RepID=UPI000E87C270|nr:ACP phosphodiesterase [Erwinia sp.]HBV38180.1 ACP phosphodiesterase [Erwinia sp.]